MCSIGEDDFGDEGGAHAMTRDDIQRADDIELERMCKKCNQNLAILKINYREPECKNCFLAYVRHKFRATLGSTKILPKNADVLLVFNGKSSCKVLLDMLQFAQTQDTFKRLHCSTNVLYIDEYFTNKSEVLVEVSKFLSKYAFDSFVVSINGGSNPVNFKNLKDYLENSLNKSKNDEFVKKLEAIKSLTSRQDYLRKLKMNILKKTADLLGSNFVFLSDISTDLATTLLTNVALGQGGSAAHDVSLCDNRHKNFKIVRPLKDLTDQEVENYIKVQNLNDGLNTTISIHGDSMAENTSIQNLTKDFINNLQKGFSSTVSTVYRTGDKIAPYIVKEEEKLTANLDSSNIKCSFCHSILDYWESNTLLAIEFSKLVSENTTKANLENVEKLEKNARSSLHGNTNLDGNLKQLCHGCRNIYRDCLDPNLFS